MIEVCLQIFSKWKISLWKNRMAWKENSLQQSLQLDRTENKLFKITENKLIWVMKEGLILRNVLQLLPARQSHFCSLLDITTFCSWLLQHPKSSYARAIRVLLPSSPLTLGLVFAIAAEPKMCSPRCVLLQWGRSWAEESPVAPTFCCV